MTSFKEQCINLRKKDFTIKEIMKATGKGRSSVYYHIKDISLSQKRTLEISEAAGKRMAAHNKSRKGRSALGRTPKPFRKWDKNKVRLVAHLIFDGEIGYSGCAYTNSNSVLINIVENLMHEIYDFKPKYGQPTPGVHRISYHNVELAEYLKQKAEELLKNIEGLPKSFQKEFLIAFFDDEGSVYFINKKRLVRGYQHNFKILSIIQKLLLNFDIKSKVDRKYNEITISRKENLIKFRDKVGFTSGIKINGNRKNSVWKKGLEKMEILKMAISSYKLE